MTAMPTDPFSSASLGGFASLAGSLLSSFGGGYSSGDQYRAGEIQLALDKRRARVMPNAIRIGAEKAGLHPLFAMGITPQMGQAAAISGQSDSGSQLGRGISNAISEYQQIKEASRVNDATIEEAKARSAAAKAQALRDTAAAAEINSRVKRAEQRANSQQDSAATKEIFSVSDISKQGQEVKNPAAVYDSSPSSKWRTSNTPPAQAFEEEYGDVGSAAYGVLRLLNDFGHNSYDVIRELHDTLIKNHPDYHGDK